MRFRLVARNLEEKFPRERISVRVQANRGQSEHDIARRNSVTVDYLLAIDNAYDESGNIVFAVRIKSRHLRCLATQQRATILTTTVRDALDDARNGFRRELASCDVIEKEKRTRALHQNVVDAMVHEVATDRIVNAGREGDLQFGSNAIRGCDQHRLPHLGKRAVEHAAEAANLRKRPRIESRT